MFRITPCRNSGGRRAAVDLLVCLGWVGFTLFYFIFSFSFLLERTRPTASMKTPCIIYLPTSNDARPTERSDRGRFLPIGEKASSYRGACRVPIFNLSVCVSVCVTFFVFTDCESCTRPISTNPGCMEAGEYGLTRGTCFFARRLELVAVAGLLWIYFMVFFLVSGGISFPFSLS